MINRFLVTGDCHGDFSRFKNYDKSIQEDPKTALIILGDVGLNWTLDERDARLKNFLSKEYKFRIYCVRGNHEARPTDVPGMEEFFDPDVCGFVYYQPKWPNIRYFKDFAIYWLGGFRVAVIGGAYSVDKWYRLDNGYIWYDNEQLTSEEMKQCERLLTFSSSASFDFVFTHTCPISWEPTDLFLSSVNQAKVDKSMEKFFEKLKNKIHWNVWLFAHYHRDRLVRPRVEMFYTDTEDLNDVMKRWLKYDANDSQFGSEDCFYVKDPNFYMK